MSIKKTGLVLILGGLFVALLVACGGDDDSSDSSNTTGADVAPTATRTSNQAQPTVAPGVTTIPAVGATVQVGAGVGGACALVTKADAQTALGEAVKDPVGVNVGSQSFGPGVSATIANCTFDSTTTAKSVTVNLWNLSGGTADQMRQLMDQILCAGKEKASGVGDNACWYDSNHRELQAIKGTTFVDITITETSGPNRQAALTTLAQKALSNVR